MGFKLTLEAARPRIATIDMAKAFESYHLTHAERNRVQEARKALLQDPRPETLKLLQVELGVQGSNTGSRRRGKTTSTGLPAFPRQTS